MPDVLRKFAVPTTPSTDTASLLSRLEGVAAYQLEITGRSDLSPSLIEVILAGNIETLKALPGNDLMLAVPVEGGDGSFRRRYSVRSLDSAAGTVTLWIDTVAGGPGARWAQHAAIGSSIECIGPRGKVTLDPLADWHLFVGDLSFLAAASSMAEAIEAPGQAIFLFEVDEPDDLISPSLDDGIGVTVGVIERSGRSKSDPVGLMAGLAALEFPADEGHFYLGGELSVVAALKTALLQRGVETAQIHAKPYWRSGVANLAHGEPRKDDVSL
ncbi:MAG: siderophore-interacting protein [Actinomycetes bacterium]